MIRSMSRPAFLAFDVNETLLSLAPIKAKFEEAFGIGAPLGEWFSRMLHGSLVANHVGDYRSFGEIGMRKSEVWRCAGKMPKRSYRR